MWFPSGSDDAEHTGLPAKRASVASRGLIMGSACVVVSGTGAGGRVSGFGSLLAPFPCAAFGLWHTDHCAVFLGHGRTAPIRLCRKSSYWRMVVVICDATGLGCRFRRLPVW